ncbi:MAG: serine/threonine protein kinase [Myxococcales bacterium]|nr:serine/threonine protein kinase [Myxococcales bacterium]MCB9625774.1 serine/threonine protein kinase [Sandaracinaceae bacterium]
MTGDEHDDSDNEPSDTPMWRMRRPTPALGLATVGLEQHTAPGYRQAAARVGEVLGQRYELLSVLGSGTAGSVFRARDAKTGAAVALKLLHEKLKGSAHDRLRFEREVAAAATVHHPNIVRMLDRGLEPDGTPYQVLEILEGRALDAAGEDGPLEFAPAVDITRQLLAALSAVHLHGYVHRDVKPENIFLLRNPDGYLQVKLIDFGIARLLDDAKGGTITDDDMVLGSPSFMSPEQISSDHPVSPATDVWQTGAVLFYMLTGRPPFQDNNLSNLLVRIAREPAPNVATFRPDCPYALAAIVAGALRRNPEHRYADAHQMSIALHKAAKDLGV